MMDHHNQKNGSRETQNWTLLEVTTSYLHGKHGVEVRIMSLSRDNTDSWVRIFLWIKQMCDGFEQQRHRNS